MSKVAGVYLPRYEPFALQQFFVFLMCQSQLNISCNFTRLCIKWDSELLVAHAAVGTNTQQTLSGSIFITSALTSSHMTTLCRKLSKSSLLFHVITARPWLSHWPPLPRPCPHISNSLWLIQAGQLVDFHHLMQAVSASLLSCCLSNCQLPRLFLLLITFQAAGYLLGPSSYYCTRWMHFAAAVWKLKLKSGQLKVLVCCPYISSFAGWFRTVNFWYGSITSRYCCNCRVDSGFKIYVHCMRLHVYAILALKGKSESVRQRLW